ncbi:predicted protein [Nematostella vectensis]|uniref:Uncharacterized protein n=1 Tax=Nematostella vectensis TaxID=45351 RepID=A7SF67_NEMVE|nr:predicted protein [Nematostella vectensis]|eukprot:XP_001629695.1 predicted protein [Nematostella vectensis]
MANDYHVFLSSIAIKGALPGNTASNFGIVHDHRLDLSDGPYECAVTSVVVPNTWLPFSDFEHTLWIYVKVTPDRRKTIPYAKWVKVEISTIKRTSDMWVETAKNVQSALESFSNLPYVYDMVGTPGPPINLTFNQQKKQATLTLSGPIQLLKAPRMAKALGLSNTVSPRFLRRLNPDEESLVPGIPTFGMPPWYGSPEEANQEYAVYEYMKWVPMHRSSSFVSIENAPGPKGKPFQDYYLYSGHTTGFVVPGGDNSGNLMRVFTPKCDDGDMHEENFLNPFYFKIRFSFLDTFRIQIADDSGNIIKFQSGAVKVALHIRPQKR